MGMQLLAIEKERPYVDSPRAMMQYVLMNILWLPNFTWRQMPKALKHFYWKTKKKEVVEEHGLDKYDQMERLDDPDKMIHTNNTIIPNFLDQAILSLQFVWTMIRTINGLTWLLS